MKRSVLFLAIVGLMGIGMLKNAYAQAGNALTFDAVDDSVARPVLSTQVDNITMEAWVNWGGYTGSNQFIMNNGNTGTNGYGLFIDAAGSQLNLLNGGVFILGSGYYPNPGVWFHVAAVRSSGTWRIYVDGVEMASDVFGPSAPAGAFTIGSSQNGLEKFVGEIDDIRFWEVARTESEINNSRFSPLGGGETGLRAYYKCDESGAATTLADATVNGLNITLINFSGSYFNASGAMRLSAPATLEGTIGFESVALSWSPVAGNTFLRYRIYEDDDPQFGSPTLIDSTADGDPTDTTASFSGLPNYTIRHYAVVALDNSGSEGALSIILDIAPSQFIPITSVPFTSGYEGNFVWGDYDNDGDYDVFIGGTTEETYPPYTSGFAKLYRNDGGNFTEVNAGFAQQIHKLAAAWSDYNNDGFLDLIYTGSSGNGTRTLKLYKNNGDGTFTDVPNSMTPVALSSLAWGDYDNDGDQDIIIMGNTSSGGSYSMTLYRNDGKDQFNPVDTGLPDFSSGSVAWGDYDNDGDLDLLVLGEYSGGSGVFVYRNDGADQFVELTGEGPLFPAVYRGQAVWADYDNDGFLDVIFSGSTGGGGRLAAIYRNEGFDFFSDINAGLTGLARSTVTVGDYDNDGDLDIFMSGNEFSDGSQRSFLYINEGGDVFTQLNSDQTGIANISGGYQFQPASGFVDFDRDGDLDLMIEGFAGSGGGGQIGLQGGDVQVLAQGRTVSGPAVILYENRGTVFNTPPSDPTALVANASEDTVYFSWTKSTDAETPQAGLTYNLRVGTTPAGVQTMSPMAKVVGSGNAGGFRLVHAMGNAGPSGSWRLNGLADGQYYWSVEAIDQVYRNSKFQTEGTFVIDGPPSQVSGVQGLGGNLSASLVWSAQNKSDVRAYYIFDGQSYVDSAVGGISDTSIVITGLDNESIYYFQIEAHDAGGRVGPLSDAVSVRPSATPGRIIVTNSADAGTGSLRDAIATAEMASQPDTITFTIPVGSVIYVASELPWLSGGRTIIEGDINKDGNPDITLSAQFSDYDGIHVTSSNNVIQGLVLSGFTLATNGGTAIWLDGPGAGNNRILGNWIGLDSTGLGDQANTYGIKLTEGASGNWIGDGTATGRNIISGNVIDGIYSYAINQSNNDNMVLGNWIGLDAVGAGLGNAGHGINLYRKSSNWLIGDGTISGRNIISGNTQAGINIDNNDCGECTIYPSFGHKIFGNYIGTSTDGLNPIGNQNGLVVVATNIMIGDGSAGGRNIISGNTNAGIEIQGYATKQIAINGNYIGLGTDGLTPLSNNVGIHAADQLSLSSISNNVVSGNLTSGIDLSHASDMSILSNKVGTDAGGSMAIANAEHGINLYATQNMQIGDGTAGGRNIISGNTLTGIWLQGDMYSQVDNVIIEGNYIGIDGGGNSSLPNMDGIYLSGTVTYTLIKGNVVSGNDSNGIGFGAPAGTSNNDILGNFIGTNASGTLAVGNGKHGVYVDAAGHSEVHIGDGTVPGRNIVSGNGGAGIYLHGTYSDVVLGNFIGVDVTGSNPIPNHCGIWITSAYNINIGSTETVDSRNVISGNIEEGIDIDDADSLGVYNLVIENNEISNNGSEGVKLYSDGQTSLYNNTVTLCTIKGNGGDGILVDGAGAYDNVFFQNVFKGNGNKPINLLAGAQHQITSPVIDSLGQGGIAYGTSSPFALVQLYRNGQSVGELFFDTTYADINGVWSKFMGNDLIGGHFISVLQDSANNTSEFGTGFEVPKGTLTPFASVVDFGNVGVGDSALALLGGVVSGYGVIVSSGGLDFDNVFHFIGGTQLPDTLFNGDTTQGTLKFKPDAFQAYSDTNKAVTNAIGGDVKITILGTGVAGSLLASSSSLDYGLVLVGDSSTQNIQLSVITGAVVLDSSWLAGTDFTAQGLSLPVTLFLGDTLDISLKFKPTTFGSASDSLEIFNNSLTSPFTIQLSGTGGAGMLTVSSSTVDFSNVLAYADSSFRSVKIYTTLGSVEITSDQFDHPQNEYFGRITPLSLPYRLNQGDTLNYDLGFAPSEFGSFSDTLRIQSNATNGEQSVVTLGVGQPGTFAFMPPSLNFGSVLVGDSAEQVVRFYAPTGAVIWQDAQLDDGIYFDANGGVLPDTLFTGDTVDVMVKFRPTTFGQLIDTVRFMHNGTNAHASAAEVRGIGSAGSLTAAIASMNFGTVYVGDSVQQSAKVYTVAGSAQVSAGSLGLGSNFSLSLGVGLPVVLNPGDTLVANVTFRPTVGGSLIDTLRLDNNTSVTPLSIALVGTGRVNLAPNSFSIKSIAGNLTNNLTPTLSWQGRGDPDGDVLAYDVVVSKNSNLSSPVFTTTVSDTSVATTKLDTVALYYFRITARDPRGLTTSSNTGFFRTDGKKPTLALGVLSLKAIKKHVQVYVATSEVLTSRSISFNLNGTVDNTKTLTLVPGQTKIYQSDYDITATGSLAVTSVGTDSAGNVQNTTKNYTIASLSKNQMLSMSFEGLDILALKGTVSEDGYLIASVVDRELEGYLSKELGRVSGITSSQELIKVVELVSTSSLNKNIELKVGYEESLLGYLKGRYVGFDERKIGLYREEEDGSYSYLTGQGSNGELIAKTNALGRLVVLYDDTRSILPESVELSQNYPNPFNPTTTIRYGVPQAGRVKLVIYNVLGQVVSELVNTSKEAGYYEVIWNGRNRRNMQVSSGIYLYRLETAQGVVTRKMTFLK